MGTKRIFVAAAASLLLAGAATAQPYGMGPAMMGGYGPGTMAPQGGYGMGPGAMWNGLDEAYAGLDLTPEQRSRIGQIEQETAQTMWPLMGAMHGQRARMQGLFEAAPLDEAEARKTYQAMNEAQKAMFDTQLEARKRIDAVLTDKQREQLRRHWGSR